MTETWDNFEGRQARNAVQVDFAIEPECLVFPFKSM